MAENHEIANDWANFIELSGNLGQSDEMLVYRLGQVYRATSLKIAGGTLGQQAIETEPSGDQAIAAGDPVILDYSGTSFTTGADDFSVTSGRVQVFQQGVYCISVGAIIEAVGAALTQAILAITRNGDAISAMSADTTISASTNRPLNSMAIAKLNAGDIIDARLDIVQAGPGLGSGIVKDVSTVAGLNAGGVNRMSIVRIGT